MTITTVPNAFQTTTIRPGLLVSLSVRVRGGVRYDKQDIEAAHPIQEGEATTRAKWETTRIVTDADEFDRAQKVRSQARSIVARECCETAVGLLCPQGCESSLAEAVAKARRMANDFNATAQHSNIEVYILTGRVSSDDAEAMRAINAEVRELLGAMEAGVKAADPEAIRNAASKARAMSGVLSGDVQAKVGKAIEQSRKIARELLRAVEAGESAAAVVDQVKLEALEAARFAVLDIEDARAGEAGQEQAGRAIEFDPPAADVTLPPRELPSAVVPAFEL